MQGLLPSVDNLWKTSSRVGLWRVSLPCWGGLGAAAAGCHSRCWDVPCQPEHSVIPGELVGQQQCRDLAHLGIEIKAGFVSSASMYCLPSGENLQSLSPSLLRICFVRAIGMQGCLKALLFWGLTIFVSNKNSLFLLHLLKMGSFRQFYIRYFGFF